MEGSPKSVLKSGARAVPNLPPNRALKAGIWTRTGASGAESREEAGAAGPQPVSGGNVRSNPSAGRALGNDRLGRSGANAPVELPGANWPSGAAQKHALPKELGRRTIGQSMRSRPWRGAGASRRQASNAAEGAIDERAFEVLQADVKVEGVAPVGEPEADEGVPSASPAQFRQRQAALHAECSPTHRKRGRIEQTATKM